MKIAIHQPNFFPHKAFFNKMEMVDVFVILRNCQFEKNGYQNRFNINDKWYTMSVSKKTDSILHKEYLNPEEDWKKIKTKLKGYGLPKFDINIHLYLHYTNTEIIKKIRNLLGIKTKIEFDFPTELRGTQRLVEICEEYGADTYVAGPSGADYMDMNVFKKAGIKVEFQKPSITIPILECL